MISFENMGKSALVLRSILDGIWEYDIERNRTYFSSTWRNSLGYEDSDLQEATYETWLKLLHPDDRDKVGKLNSAYLNKEVDTYEVEFRMPTKAGNYKWFLSRGNAIWNEEGKAIYMAGVHIDIQDRKVVLENLEESEKVKSLILENANDAIFLIEDLENENIGEFVEVNEQACRLLAYEKDELVGMCLGDMHQPGELDILSEDIEKVRKEKRHIFETELLSKDGRVIPVEISAQYFQLEGKKMNLSIVRDMSERKETERGLRKLIEENNRLLQKAKEYDRLKTEFFCNISHELKTPLNVILGVTELLRIVAQEKSCSAACHKNVATMKQNCYRLLRLIDNLIDLNRLDTGFMKIYLQNYNIVAIVEEITLSVAKYVESKGIDLVFDTDIEELWIACDADKLERIILNLLSNAIKFTEEGSITVRLSSTEYKVMISVKDTGIGIPEDQLGVIFERFRQVDASLNRRSEGSGIGLSLIKALIEAHGGGITVESKWGDGSEFIIQLPIKRIKDDVQEEISCTLQTNVERVRVEFSDIYALRGLDS